MTMCVCKLMTKNFFLSVINHLSLTSNSIHLRLNTRLAQPFISGKSLKVIIHQIVLRHVDICISNEKVKNNIS